MSDNNVDAALGTSIHARVLESLGLEIARKQLAEGSSFTIEELEQQVKASRSVIREVLRVLESKGMVRSKKRVGVEILPSSQWSLFDPSVIRWRLSSPDRIPQLRSLVELRRAIEPEAARLAAQRATIQQRSALMGVAAQVWEVGQGDDMAEFIRLDVEYHRILMESSGNPMFGMLDTLIGEVITGREKSGYMPNRHSPVGLQLHLDVAIAVQVGDSEAAYAAMLEIITLAIAEMEAIWADSPKTHLGAYTP